MSLRCCDGEDVDRAVLGTFITLSSRWRPGESDGRSVTLPGSVDPRGNATADHSERPASIGR